MSALNATHDPARRSIVPSANEPETDFPIQNLPLGIFSRGAGEQPRPGMAIGDQIVDLAAVQKAGALDGKADEAVRASAQGPGLNALMALGNVHASALRGQLSDLLSAAGSARIDIRPMLVPMWEATLHLPTNVRNFTDFLTSSNHSVRLNPTGVLAKNFMSLPLAYHSRASSVRLSGDVKRPNVQQFDGTTVSFGPTQEMDFELEVGAFIGPGNELGDPIRIRDAANHLFGFCLLNDWSVRDTQRWESPPLGPFLSKSLSTTISPWVVTEEALRPFRTHALRRGEGEWAPLPHMTDDADQTNGALDLDLEALLLTTAMRDAGEAPARITATNAKHLYWTFAQMLTHHSSNGCNMLPGDLIGSGTVSGPVPESRACLAEVNKRGSEAFTLPNGESRTWLEDGDEVILRARARREGFVSIAFGACVGRLLPAPAY